MALPAFFAQAIHRSIPAFACSGEAFPICSVAGTDDSYSTRNFFMTSSRVSPESSRSEALLVVMFNVIFRRHGGFDPFETNVPGCSQRFCRRVNNDQQR